MERHIRGVTQMQVNPLAGLTFDSGLRALLRQDPDIIMVGETRDSETASISVRSAITGHLVLSTLHTNDALSTIVRLEDMGVEPFLVANSVVGLVAQRLVRRICPHCKEAYQPRRTGAGALRDAPGASLSREGLPGLQPDRISWADRGPRGGRGRSGDAADDYPPAALLRICMPTRGNSRASPIWWRKPRPGAGRRHHGGGVDEAHLLCRLSAERGEKRPWNPSIASSGPRGNAAVRISI